MLNVPTVQRALAGKCLIKLTINSSSYWSASCFLCVFSQSITGRGVDCLMKVSWLRGRWWFRCPFHDLMLLNKTLWIAVTCCDLMDRRIVATFDHDHSKNVMQYKKYQLWHTDHDELLRNKTGKFKLYYRFFKSKLTFQLVLKILYQNRTFLFVQSFKNRNGTFLFVPKFKNRKGNFSICPRQFKTKTERFNLFQIFKISNRNVLAIFVT